MENDDVERLRRLYNSKYDDTHNAQLSTDSSADASRLTSGPQALHNTDVVTFKHTIQLRHYTFVISRTARVTQLLL